MFAYHSNPEIKSAILDKLAAHRAADQIVKGIYWENGKGCAVGCTIESGRHAEYETRFGIPQILARLEDPIFENLPNHIAVDWPIRFMDAIKPGADLTLIWPRFALWLLSEELPQRTANFPKATAALADVAALYCEWLATRKNPEAARWRAVAQTSRDAADAAYAAGRRRAGIVAKEAAFVRMADKMIELLSAADV